MTNDDIPVSDIDAAPASDAPATPDLAAVRELVLRAHPDVVPELIGGDSVDALLASVEPAQVAYRRLADTIGQSSPAPSVPAGGQRPAAIDPDRLPASEKIRRGLARSR